MMPARKRRMPERGYAILTAMLLLLVLTLAAFAALRGTAPQEKMSRSNASATLSFESSESGRSAASDLIDALCFARDWPQTISSGSGVTAAAFDQALPPGLDILPARSPEYWCIGNGEPGAFNPNRLQVDATYHFRYPGGTASAASGDVSLDARISVYRLDAAGAPGAGQAQAYGYSSPGIAAANGGGNLYFYVQSRGVGNNGAPAEAGNSTSAAFRYVIRH